MTPVLFLSSLVLSQVPPPLAHLLDAARAHNHSLGISRAQLHQQEAQVDQAFAAFLPTVRASAGYSRNEYEAVVSLPASLLGGGGPPGATETLVIQPYNAWTANVSVNVPLLTAGNYYRHAEAEEGRDAAAGAARASEAEVMLSTARAYFHVVGAQGVVEAAQKALSTAQDNLGVTKVKFNAGTQTRLAVDRAQVDVARAQQTVVAGQQTLQLAVRSLETLTGERSTGPFPAPDEPVLPTGAEDAFVDEALRVRPEVQQAAAALRQQELASSEAWAQLAPSLSGSAGETFTNITGFTGQHDYWTLGVNLAWNLDPVGVRASVRRADASVDEQHHRLAQAQDTVRDDVHTAWLDVDAGAARVAQAGSEMRSAQDALVITREQYAAGTATSLDVSQAQRDAFNAEATFAQSRADLAAALLALRKAAGEPFWLAEGSAR